MKNSLKNIFKILIWPIIFMLGQFFIQYIFVAIFNAKEKGSMTTEAFLEYIKTDEYNLKLNNFIDSRILIIGLIVAIIFIPLFYRLFKKYKVKNNFKINDIIIPILFGISISLIYNITLFNLNNVFYFTNIFEPVQLPLIVNILTSGILGPIIEEFLFRGIVYNRLKEFNSPMKSMIITGILFGIFHIDIINAIYGFGVNFILIYLYEKYKSLKAPIIMHISLNTIILIMFNLIVKNYMIFNLYLLVVSILVLLILKKIIKKDV